MKSRFFAAALAAPFLILSACSPAQAPANPQTNGQQAASQPAAPVTFEAAPAPVNAKSQWLSVAHTDAKGGGIFVDPSLRRVDPATGLSDVTLKVVHGDLNAVDAAAGDTGSNLYREEKVTFRFDCPKRVYALVKREALNKNGDVIATTAEKVTEASYREVAPGGVAGVAQSQACVRR